MIHSENDTILNPSVYCILVCHRIKATITTCTRLAKLSLKLTNCVMFESRTRIDDCQGGDLLLAYAQTIEQLIIKILRGVKRHSNHPDKSVRLIKSVSNIIGTTKTKMHIPYSTMISLLRDLLWSTARRLLRHILASLAECLIRLRL